MKSFRNFHSSATHTTESMKSHVSTVEDRKNHAVWIGRVVFLLCLGLTAAILGFVTFRLLSESEKELAESQFEAIADRALASAFERSSRKRLGTVTMATIAANVNPDADQWPFVTVRGYENITTNLIETSSGREMGFAPLVIPEQLSEFEEFAYEYFFSSREPPFPEETATSSFGRGVWGVNPALNTSDNRYHETDGSTSYNSPNKIFAPILQHNAGAHKALMLNLHFQETRGVIIDNLIACSEKRKETQSSATECGAITDFLILTSQEFRPGPGALLMQPIYPSRSPYDLKGILASSIIWDEVLTNVFTASVSGVDCMLRSPGGEYTYRIQNGHVNLKGEGDLRDKEFIEYCRSIDLMQEGFFSADSVSYTLLICPSKDFFGVYSTKNPCIATIGSVCIIIFSALVFFSYDRCVRKEFDARQKLLDAKRKFVRFVSHEVRTPLNSVCMGLALMQDGMTKALKTEANDIKKPNQVTVQEQKPENPIEEWHELIDDVLNNAQAAVDVLNDLLNYDKIEMGSFNLEVELLWPWKLAAKVVNEFQLPASKKQVDLKLILMVEEGNSAREITDQPSAEISKMVAVADPFRLTQVVRNLISNAIKFTPERGEVNVHVTVYVSTEAGITNKITLHSGKEVEVGRSGRIIVEVKDSGAGLTPDQVVRLFKQGVQFDANRLQAGQGSGLGLFIAKGIAEQHNGSLEVQSPGLGKGTTFTLSLPLFHVVKSNAEGFCLSGEGVDEPEIVFSDNNSASASLPHQLRVLVVDDSSTNRRLLLRYLHRTGHICGEAADGVEAIERVANSMEKGEPYDTILMDFEMPRMNGPKATKAIRQAGCDSFVVGISGNVLPEDVAYFCEHGANAVLPKPVQFSDLEALWYEYGFPDKEVLGPANNV